MSALSDAITASIVTSVSANSPEAKRDNQVISGYLNMQKQDITERKAQTIEYVAQLLTEAIANQAPQSVITAYEKLFAEVAGS